MTLSSSQAYPSELTTPDDDPGSLVVGVVHVAGAVPVGAGAGAGDVGVLRPVWYRTHQKYYDNLYTVNH